MSVGVPALDSDHRCLIRVVNLLRGVRDDDEAATMIATVLDTILLYARFHFAREERVMELFRFPQAAHHQGEHQVFADDIEGVRERYLGPATTASADALFDELADWLRHHILIQDMAYRPYILDVDLAEQTARSGTAACLLSMGTARDAPLGLAVSNPAAPRRRRIEPAPARRGRDGLDLDGYPEPLRASALR